MHEVTTAGAVVLLAALLAATPVAAKGTADVSPNAPAMVELSFITGSQAKTYMVVELNSVPYTTMKSCGASLAKDTVTLASWVQSHHANAKAIVARCVLRPKYMRGTVRVAN
jgi:hypothetical protein